MHYQVLQPDEGESYWQPEPANGYVTFKATPAGIPGIGFSQGIQVIPPGSRVREHSHGSQEEVIFCIEGRGRAEIDGKSYPMVPGTVLALGRTVRHSFLNEGDAELKFIWTIAGPGLERFFAEIGRPRRPGEPAPTSFDRPSELDPDRRNGLSVSERV